ncbi:uncharacterized protein K452DRAFT_217127 [Aplosporella prunicola CBS 121167]|uniref:PXA domain-containing protein n=1 Tax=Aplosporella prunicola CBS 121167 TaxID=1176127 RepID=A0A6A6BW19_9PEZI|nr:uncharacterized protein K452DRAFT_217127 [Aplosporella prunicola CBS 121167]KAF2147543.1 hypothetical protein K452DRAFT_217127 [Aplosporella prunicola CBS 121167]
MSSPNHSTPAPLPATTTSTTTSDDARHDSPAPRSGALPNTSTDAAPEPSSAPAPPPVNLQAFTDRALRFLSTATNETLGACLVGLGATTYLVLGRVGLVLIGVVGGIVLHAQWEGGGLHGDGASRAAEEKRRKDIGLDVVHRVLKARNSAKEEEAAERRNAEVDVQLFSGKQLDYSAFRPETGAALNELTDAVIKEYVKWWYNPIIPGEFAFPAACRNTLAAFIISVSNHLSRKRPADLFLEFLTNSSAIVIVFLHELSGALASSPNTPPAEAVQNYLKLKPDCNLASVLDRKHQAKKLDMVADDVLENYLESKTYNCKPARVFLREILAKVVLDMTITSCSTPECINGWIVYFLEEGEPEFMNAIDAGVEGATGQPTSKSQGETKQQAAERENAAGSPSEEGTEDSKKHKRTVSRAQDAMDDAMKEAQRLTQMIVEDDARRLREQLDREDTEKDKGKSSTSFNDDMSESTTQGVATPSSSQSDHNDDRRASLQDSTFMKSPNDSITKATNPSEKTSSKEPQISSPSSKRQTFTSFDQIVTEKTPTALGGTPQEIPKPPPLTLHNANIAIFDDATPGDKSTIKSKPVGDYLIQIEPSTSHHSGWMIARKYADFETLHEVLKRISIVSGVPGFTEAHSKLPSWKGHTKSSLRGELERYLNDAMSWQPLAESEGMKRFLEKERGLDGSPVLTKPGFGWPTPSAFEAMGKGMFDALAKAPKEVAGGGKAVFGNITGAFGALGPKRKTTISKSAENSGPEQSTPTPSSRHKRAESTVSELPNPTHMRSESMLSIAPGRRSQDSVRSPVTASRRSTDSLRTSPIIDQQPAPIAQMERRPSYQPDLDAEYKMRPTSSSRSSVYGRSSVEHSRAPSRSTSARESLDISPLMGGDQILNLPPLPSDITDDYVGEGGPLSPPQQRKRRSEESRRLSRASTAAASEPAHVNGGSPPKTTTRSATTSTTATATEKDRSSVVPKTQQPLNEQETQMAVELFFAIINELYTMSSVWQIRKSLLTAAKTFLLRPGNPQLESIRVLLQDTVLEANSSDTGIAGHLLKLRMNALPSDEERSKWPGPMSPEDKERLRVKARKLLVERGMPQALTSVMGQAASGEALGRVFDCLQVESVARGFVFGLLLQGVRAVTA